MFYDFLEYDNQFLKTFDAILESDFFKTWKILLKFFVEENEHIFRIL